MIDWNVVVTTRGRRFTLACELLEEFGRVGRTHFYNVIVMKVADVGEFAESLAAEFARSSMMGFAISRVAPAQHAFDFVSPEAFEERAGEIALTWVDALAGKRFHVRMHRRGFKGRLSSQDEERFLDGALLEALHAAGAPGAITFDDPDAIIAIDTVDKRAGLSLWTRDELARYPFLALD